MTVSQEPIHVSTCTKCQHCGEWTNYAGDEWHQHRERLLSAIPSMAARDVMAERQRQISVEGWTPERDDGYSRHELAMAAACYAVPFSERQYLPISTAPKGWPWDAIWWKPMPYDRRRELVKAAALLLAEIERLDRAEALRGGEAGK